MPDLPELKNLLKRVMAEERFAVLATQYEGQPYTSLVAFVPSDDLLHIIFATNRNTQKYRNIIRNSKVAVLIDSRRNMSTDVLDTLAVTGLGKARELTGDMKDMFTHHYLARHSDLTDFLHQPETAMIQLTVSDYILAGFNQVERISPEVLI